MAAVVVLAALVVVKIPLFLVLLALLVATPRRRSLLGVSRTRSFLVATERGGGARVLWVGRAMDTVDRKDSRRSGRGVTAWQEKPI